MSSQRSILGLVAGGGLALLLAGPGADPARAAGSGEEIFKAQTCDTCHSVSTAGIESKMKSGKMKGPDLAHVKRDAQWIRDFVTQVSDVDGRKHPKKFTGSEAELATLLEWLASQSGSSS
jgi:mono/diheme cytochrome c family protein